MRHIFWLDSTILRVCACVCVCVLAYVGAYVCVRVYTQLLPQSARDEDFNDGASVLVQQMHLRQCRRVCM